MENLRILDDEECEEEPAWEAVEKVGKRDWKLVPRIDSWGEVAYVVGIALEVHYGTWRGWEGGCRKVGGEGSAEGILEGDQGMVVSASCPLLASCTGTAVFLCRGPEMDRGRYA